MNLRNFRVNSSWLHPILIVVFFYLYSFGEYGYVEPRLFIGLILGSSFLVIIFLFIISNSNTYQVKSIILSTTLFFLLFYAHLKFYLEILISGQREYIYMLILLMVYLTVVYLFFKVLTIERSHLISKYLNLLFFSFVLLSCLNILVTPLVKESSSICNEQDYNHIINGSAKQGSPNIFLIVLDAYANSKTLKSHFEFDNSGFESALLERKFQLPLVSRSNYDNTLMSMTSCLNMAILEEEKSTTLIRNHLNFGHRLKNNCVKEILEKAGYRIENLSIFDFQNYPSKVRTNLHYRYLNGFNAFVFSKTLFGYLSNVYNRVFAYKREVEAIKLLDSLILKEVEKPMFAYYHSLIPHVPYYFQGNGSLKSLNSALSVGSYQDYIQQIEYSNLLTLKQIDRILKYKPNSIIMIMSDHGFKNLQGVSQEVKSVEALKNFSALYCPNNAKVRLDSLLTPISLMKIVLDQALLKKSSE